MVDTDTPEQRILLWGKYAAISGLVIQTASHLFNAWVLDYRLAALSAEWDTSVWAWASTVATFAAALMLCLLVICDASLGRHLWLTVAAISFLSLDDMNGYHERLSTLYRHVSFLPEHSGRLLWPVLFFPLLALVFVSLLRVAREFEPPIANRIRLGLALLGLAVLLEMASSALVNVVEYTEWPYVIEVTLEEGAELVGWILIAVGLSARLASVIRDTSLQRLRSGP
jgi:hypothetical protein